MATITFTTIDDASRAADVTALMQRLHQEDGSLGVDPRRFPATIQFVLDHPDQGRIVLFLEGETLVGYALLVAFWSNEFGGLLALVDELYVIPEARNQGIGRRFLDALEAARPFNAVAMFLEVSPANERARRLYESLGFRERSYTVMTRRFPSPPS